MVPLSRAGLARPPSLGGTRSAASNSELQIYWSVLANLRVLHGAVHLYYGSKTAAWELRELLVFGSQLAGRHSKRVSGSEATRVPRTSHTCQRRSGMTGCRSLVTPSKIMNGRTRSAHRTCCPTGCRSRQKPGPWLLASALPPDCAMSVHLTIGTLSGGGESALARFPTTAGKRKLCRLSGPPDRACS